MEAGKGVWLCQTDMQCVLIRCEFVVCAHKLVVGVDCGPFLVTSCWGPSLCVHVCMRVWVAVPVCACPLATYKRTTCGV